MDKPYIRMEKEIDEAMMELRAFLFKNIYTNTTVKAEEAKAIEMLRILFDYFVSHSDELPDVYRKNIEAEGVKRCVCDYISGMTDRYATDLFRDLYVPNSWRRK
jgi:dGTPase